MIKLLKKLTISHYAAIGTWAVIFGISLNFLLQPSSPAKVHLSIVIVAFVIYLACFLVLTSETLNLNQLQSNTILLLQFMSAIGLMLVFPANYLAILTIIYVAIFMHYYSVRATLFMTLVAMTAYYLIFHIHWQQGNVLMTTLLYGTFHIFAIMMTHQTQVAEGATEQVKQLYNELQSTHHLLEQATRQNERTRISRDLHDLLGHHLTALIINLQVASRVSDGEAQEKIETCHGLAKLLLSDVREAVSSLRESQDLDFQGMIDLMTANIPHLRVQTQIDSSLQLEDLSVARTLLSCIQEAMTNTLRHADADTFSIHLSQDDQRIMLEITDNGSIDNHVEPGNGLKGMQERIEELQGQFSISCTPPMTIAIEIPRA